MTNARIGIFLLMVAIGIAAWMVTCAAADLDEVAAGVVPLDPRTFEEFSVVTLGTGGAVENHHRHGPATAIAHGDVVLLVEAGRGVAESLRAAKIPPSQPSVVLLSSRMPENVLGLDDLLANAWIAGRREPIRLLGPAGVEQLARNAEQTVAPGLEARARALGIEAPPLRYLPQVIPDGFEASFGGIKVRAGALPDGPIESLAYRFEANGRSAVVSGAGWAPDALTRFATGAHLLVHEGAMVPTPEEAAELGLEEDPESLRREARFYGSLAAAGGIARRAGIETLVLVRLRPPPVYELQVTSLVDDQFAGEVAIAIDGDTFTP
jgi:ribonuclease Z